jgi:gluconokinase
VSAPARVVVMGPSGAGKSAFAATLAHELGARFVDSDDLHPAVNVQKMAAGNPLTDDDRMPWLDVVGQTIQSSPSGIVVACSALARRYRDRIRATAPATSFVELLVPREELDRRMREREHFMPATLLDSQLEVLEHLGPDERGVQVRNVGGIDEAVRVAAIALAIRPPSERRRVPFEPSGHPMRVSPAGDTLSHRNP